MVCGAYVLNTYECQSCRYNHQITTLFRMVRYIVRMAPVLCTLSVVLSLLLHHHLLAVQDIQTTGGVSYLAALEVVVSV